MIAQNKFKGILFLLCLLIYNSKPFIITKEATPDNSNDENETVYFDPNNDNLAFDTNEQYDDTTKEPSLESIYSIQNLSDRVEQIDFDQFPEKTVIQDKYDPKIFIKIIRVNFIVTNDDPCNEILEFSEKLFKIKFNNPDNLGLNKFRIIINNQNKKLFCYKIDENNIPQIPDNYDQIQNNNYTIIDTSAENILNDTDVNKKDYKAQEDLIQNNSFFKDTRYLKTEEETLENEIPLQYDTIKENRNFVVNETNTYIQTNSIEENEIKTNPREVILSNKNTFNTTSNEYMNKHIKMLKERQNSLATNKIPTPPLISQSPRLLSSERVKSPLNNNYYNDINTTFPFLNKKKDRQMQQNQQSSSLLDDLICQRNVKINKDEFYIGAHTYFNPNFINYVITTDGPDNINDKLKQPTESTNPKYQSKFTISNNNDEEKQLVSFKSSSIERNLKNSTENIIKNKLENSIFDKSNHENNLIEITKTTEGINEVTTNKYKFNIKEDYTTETSRKLHQTTKSPNERSTSSEENVTNTLISRNNNSTAILLDYNDTNTKILQNENDHFRNYTDLEHNTPAVVLDYNDTNEKTTKNENSHFVNSTDVKHNLSTVVSDFNDTYTKTLQNENDHLKNSTDENHNSFGNSVLNAGKDTIKGTIKGVVEGIYDKTKEYAGAAVEIGGKVIGIGKKGVNYLEYGINYLGSKISFLGANSTKPTIKPILNHHETHNNNIKPKNSSKEIRLDVSKPKTQNNNFTRTSANNENKSKSTSGHKNNTKVSESDSKSRTKKSEKTLDSVNTTTTKKNLNQETHTKPPKRNLTSHSKPRKTTENPPIHKNTNKTTNQYPFDTKTSTQKPFNWNSNQNNLKSGSVLQNKIFEKAENFTKFNTQGIITKLEDKLETIDNFIQIGKFGLSFIGVLISFFFLMKYLKFFGCKK